MRLLIVEDYEADYYLIREQLKAAGKKNYSFSNAESLNAALSMLQKGESFDMVLLDLGLPDSTGIESFEKLYSAAPEMPVIVLSGLDDESVSMECVKKGAQDYFVKSQLDGITLSRSLSYAIERKKSELELNRRQAVLEAINFAAEKFISNPDWESSIGSVLDNIGKSTGACSVVIYKNSKQEEWITTLAHEWTAPGVKPSQGEPGSSAIPLYRKDIHPAVERLRSDLYLCITKSEADEQGINIFEMQHTKSLLAVPVFVDYLWWGFLGLVDTKTEREWFPAEVEAVRAMGNVLATVIQRRTVELEMHAIEQNNIALVQALPDVMIKCNRAGKLEDYRPARDFTLIDPYDYEGKTVFDCFPSDYHRTLKHALQTAESGGDMRLMEYMATAEKISFYEARIVAAPGDSVIIIVRDITRGKESQKQLAETVAELKASTEELRDVNSKLSDSEAKLRELNQSKDKFFSILAHDLQSPFTGFLGLTEFLSDEAEDLEIDEIRSYSKRMHESAKSIYGLVLNLLQWSRVQTGRIKFELETINLAGLVNELMDVYHEQAQSKGIELESLIETSLSVRADRFMLHAIIRNLLSNAIKFTRRGGVVIIDASPEQNVVRVCVKDTGVGIDKEKINRLFRIDETTSTKGTEEEMGTGLGLILCQEFVKMHNGKITIESEVDKGTLFCFTIPREYTDE